LIGLKLAKVFVLESFQEAKLVGGFYSNTFHYNGKGQASLYTVSIEHKAVCAAPRHKIFTVTGSGAGRSRIICVKATLYLGAFL
jgi:hypothetical protein